MFGEYPFQKIFVRQVSPDQGEAVAADPRISGFLERHIIVWIEIVYTYDPD